jgi:hypothetical protein
MCAAKSFDFSRKISLFRYFAKYRLACYAIKGCESNETFCEMATLFETFRRFGSRIQPAKKLLPGSVKSTAASIFC